MTLDVIKVEDERKSVHCLLDGLDVSVFIVLSHK